MLLSLLLRRLPVKGCLVILVLFLLTAGISYAVMVTDGVQVINENNHVVVNMVKNGTLYIEPQVELSSSTSVGGALRVDNTRNKGAGAVLYTNAGAGARGRLMVLRCDHGLFDQDCLHVSYDGKNSGISVLSTNGPAMTLASTTTVPRNHVLGLLLNADVDDTSALNVNSLNTRHSAVQVTGNEKERGTVKIAHVKPNGMDDTNATALSIDLQGAGTAAQGIFVESTGGTTGKLLNIRNQGDEKMVLKADGTLQVKGNLLVGGNLEVSGCIIYQAAGVQQALGTCI